MRKVAVLALVSLVACAATQEGPVTPDARGSQSLTPDAAGTDAAAAPAPDAMATTPADAATAADAPVAAPDAGAADAPLPADAPPADAFVAPPPDAFVAPPPDACVPTSAVEECNGIDDNCDGHVDEGFDLGKPCTNGVGACLRPGKTVCAPDGKGVVCDAVPGDPSPFDLCHNGIDDNCDGQVDEGFDEWGTICFVGVGDCKQPGLWTCNAGKDSLVCNAIPGMPKPELCGTGHDENCDGNIDEGFPDLGQECSVGIGHCKANGLRICDPTDLTKTKCSAVQGDPEPESCNGIDDNCDGQIDENDPGGGASCLTGSMGECGPGHLHCVEGKLACVPDHAPSVEYCNGKDDDCDGIIDNGFNIGQPCNSTAPTDYCPNGHWVCANLFAATCVDDYPTPEVCNGRDDNCDGHADEDWDFFNDPNNCGGCNHVCGDLNVDLRRCSSGVCDPTCAFGWQSCDGSLDNGCETLRNTYPGDLPQPTSTAASVSGDDGQQPVVIHGFGESQIRVHVREDSDGWNDLHAQFRLQNPDGVQMHLCVYGGHCGGFGSYCTGAAADQSIWASADETPWPLSCNDDSFDVNVEVIFDDADRTACGQWTLTVYSNSDPQSGAPNIDVD